MNASIEYEGKPAVMNPDFGYVRTEDWAVVPTGSAVVICAWHHDGPAKATQATAMGYRVTHGMCKECLAKQKGKS